MRSVRLAGLSIISNTFVVGIKLIAGFLTGSVAILSEAIHSFLDLMASVITFFSVRMSRQPPDRKHPYGHGKFENIAGTIESLLVLVAGIWIIIESSKKILHPEPIQLPLLGIAVMLLGALINWVVGRVIKRVGEETKSVAMRSNALHLLTDVYSSLGVALGLLVVSLTDLYIIDSLIGIAIALYIVKEAYGLGKESFLPLLDVSLTAQEQEEIQRIIESYASEFVEYHDLRTRRSGAEEHIDLHLVVPSEMSVKHAHDLCDRIEADIHQMLHRANVLIHIEPEHEQKNGKE